MITPDKNKTWITKNGYRLIRILSGRSNVFLLTNGKINILIDTSIKYLWKKLDKKLNGLNINRINYLILTHSHFDHAGNTRRIKEKYKASVIIQKNEAYNLTTGEILLPQGTNLFTQIIVNTMGKRFASRLRFEPCQYDLSMDTEFNLNDYGFNAFILHTPGHTIGSISVIIDDEIAVVGDTMFGIFKRSVFPPFADSTSQLMNSWSVLLNTKCTIFLPSHGEEKTREQLKNDYDKKKNKYALSRT